MPENTSVVEQHYHQLAEQLQTHGVKASRMFGVECLKVKRRPFVVLEADGLVFRLAPSDCETALTLAGASPWVAKGTDRTMRGWICIPLEQATAWEHYALRALEFTLALDTQAD